MAPRCSRPAQDLAAILQEIRSLRADFSDFKSELQMTKPRIAEGLTPPFGLSPIIQFAFGDEVAKRLGMKKGNTMIAIVEAIRNWIGPEMI
jgi:hypothetical protein